MTGLSHAQVRSIGEHYVVARLTSLGFIVGMAPENTKAIDILAMNENGKRALQIQVKARTEGRSSDNGWMMNKKHEALERVNLYYVFVTLPKEWNDKDQPETFIVPSSKVASIIRQSHMDWLKTPGRNGRKRKDGDTRRIIPKYRDSPGIPSNWMDSYRDKWDILK